MKRISIATLFLAAIALLTTSCGTSDYVKSLTLSSTGTTSGGFYNLAGVDGTLQLQVLANYNSGKTIDVTNAVTWNVTTVGGLESSDDPNYPAPGPLPPYGPTTVPISSTGLMTGIDPICTWADQIVTTGTGSTATTGPANPPEWAYTGYYQVTATYRNFTSQPVGIGVGITGSNSPIGGCGPS